MPTNAKHKLAYKPDIRISNTTQLSRRKFVGSIAMGSSAMVLPWKTMAKGTDIVYPISGKQQEIIISVQSILFPSDGNGPGAWDVMADKYLLWVLSDKRIDPEESEYIIKGIGWVDETAEEIFSKNYTSLTEEQKKKLIENISNEKWGSSWLGVILSFIFEALLSDPQYGGNPDEIGWQWLNHNPGFPRPSSELLYPTIVETISKTPIHNEDE